MFLLMRWTGLRPLTQPGSLCTRKHTPGRTVPTRMMSVEPLGFGSEQPPQLCVPALAWGSGGDGALIKGSVENAIC